MNLLDSESVDQFSVNTVVLLPLKSQHGLQLTYLPRQLASPACVAQDNRKVTPLVGPKEQDHLEPHYAKLSILLCPRGME